MDSEKLKVAWVETNYNFAKFYEGRSWEDILIDNRLSGNMALNDILFDCYDKPHRGPYGSCGRKLEEELSKDRARLYPCLELVAPGSQKVHISSDNSSPGVITNFSVAEDFQRLILLEGDGTMSWIRRCIVRRNPEFSHIGVVIDYDSNLGAYSIIKESLSKDFDIKTLTIKFPYASH